VKFCLLYTEMFSGLICYSPFAYQESSKGALDDCSSGT